MVNCFPYSTLCIPPEHCDIFYLDFGIIFLRSTTNLYINELFSSSHCHVNGILANSCFVALTLLQKYIDETSL